MFVFLLREEFLMQSRHFMCIFKFSCILILLLGAFSSANIEEVIKDGQSYILENLLNSGVDVNHRDSDGNSLLHNACRRQYRNGDTRIYEILIDHGADLNLVNNDGLTPLDIAIQMGNPAVIKLLLEKDARSHSLHAAAYKGDREEINHLLEAGVDINKPDHVNRRTALFYAITAKNTDIIKFLLSRGADINFVDQYGTNPLILSLNDVSLEIPKLLIENGADINCRNFRKMTPLCHAAYLGNIDLVKLLLNYGAKIDYVHSDGYTPLIAAVESNKIEMVQFFLNKGLDINGKNGSENNPLLAALHLNELDYNDYSIAQYLIDHGAEISFRDSHLETLFERAIKLDNFNAIKFLIKNGVAYDKSMLITNGELHYGAYFGDKSRVEKCLKMGDDINKPHGNEKQTPLHYAILGRQVEMIPWLIEKGADIEVKTDDGYTALALAVKEKQMRAVEVLIASGADVNTIIKGHMNMLAYAIDEGQVDIASILIDRGADLAHDQYGRTILHYAIYKNKYDIVKMLLEKDIAHERLDPAPDPKALLIAIEQRDETMLKLLLGHGFDPNIIVRRRPLIAQVGSGADNIKNLLIEYGAKEEDADEQFTPVMTDIPPLHMAILKKDYQKAKEIVQQEGDVNKTDQEGLTALHLAANQGDVSFCLFLLENNANVHIKDRNGYTPLFSAIEANNQAVVELLVDFGADINWKNQMGISSLEYAVMQSHLEIAKYLKEKGASLNPDIINQPGIWMYAVRDRDMVQFLLDNGMEANQKTSDGITIVRVALEQGQNDIVELLVNHGASIDSHSPYLHTCILGMEDPRIISVLPGKQRKGIRPELFNRQYELLKYLVEKGAGVNALDKSGKTPLHLAVMIVNYDPSPKSIAMPLGNFDKILADQDARKDANDVEVVPYNKTIASYLLEHGANIDAQDRAGLTPLMTAAISNNMEMVQWLLSRGASLEYTPKYDMHPVVKMIENDQIEMLMYLLVKGMKIDLISTYPESPLVMAFQRGNEFVDMLLTHASDYSVESQQANKFFSQIVALYAKDPQKVSEEILDKIFMSPRFNNLDIKESASSLLITYVRGGIISAVILLMHYGADVNLKDNDGCSALWYAIENKDISMVKLLLENKAEINYFPKRGFSPLYLSVTKNDINIFRLLLDHGANAKIARKDQSMYTMLMSDNLYMHGESTPYLIELIRHGIDYNTSYDIDNKRNVWGYAVENQSIELMKEMISKGIDIDQLIGEKQVTALHIACRKANIEMVQLLLSHTADIHIKSNRNSQYGDSYPVIYFAVLSGSVEILKLIQAKGGDIYYKDSRCPSLLYPAAGAGKMEMFQYLLSEGIELKDFISNQQSLLKTAVAGGSLEIVKYLCENGFDGKDNSKESPYIVALRSGNKAIAKYLLSQGASLPTNQGQLYESPIYDAVIKGDEQLVKELLEMGVPANLTLKNGDTLLHVMYQDKPGIAKELLGTGIDVNMKGDFNKTPLHKAVRSNCIHIAKLYVENGADVNAKDNRGWTPLHEAADTCGFSTEILRLLIGQGADIEARDNQGRTPLHLAANNSIPKGTEFLINAGADINALDYLGRTPLYMSRHSGNSQGDNIKILREKGAQEDITGLTLPREALSYHDENGNSALYSAISNNHYDFTKLLLDGGLNVNEGFISGAQKENSDYPIFIAIRKGYTEIAMLLVEYGADLSLRNRANQTPLICAAEFHTEIEQGLFLTLGNRKEETEADQIIEVDTKLPSIELTIEQEVHDMGEKDFTYKKEVNGNLELIKLMIEKGADINAKDKLECTPLYYSIDLNSRKLMKLLIEKGADVNGKTNGGSTALRPAVWKATHSKNDESKKQYLEIIRYLVSQGADVNISEKVFNEPDETFLMLAVGAGDCETSKLLIELGADINAKNSQGLTALDIAKKKGHKEVVELLEN